MSKAAIEQSLTGLLPALNGPLPVELVDLAVSLLARSRSVANSLKQDEEIARPYACAQLACDRLKKRLNLPTITSRPSCPPRIYKKLYQYLDSALPAGPLRAPETPRKPKVQATASGRTTPKTPLSNRKTPRSRANDATIEQSVPEWVMPLIRETLKTFRYPNAAPHVFAGVESTLPLLARMAAAEAPETPSKRPRRSTVVQKPSSSGLSHTRVLALTAVVIFYVLSRMTDQEITPSQFIAWRDKALGSLLASPTGEGCDQEDVLAEIERLMPLAQEEGWLGMEWFLNVLPPDDDEEMEGIETTEMTGASAKGRNSSLKDSLGSDYIGLGTMMQNATDYLGERQRDDYKRWKAGIMERIEEIEAS